MRAGKAAVFAAEEFFFGRIRNEHTRAAYLIAVRRFLRGRKSQASNWGGFRRGTSASTSTGYEKKTRASQPASSTWPRSGISSMAW